MGISIRCGHRGNQVKELQEKLHDAGYIVGAIDGIFGKHTLAATTAFQCDRGLAMDGIAGKQTFDALISHPTQYDVSPEDVLEVATNCGLDTATLRAIVAVECSGKGFLDDGRPKILFEAHHFAKYTSGEYNVSHPSISSATWNSRLYGNYSYEWERLELAKSLNLDAALKSASWGLPQILGSNHLAVGFNDVREFVAFMSKNTMNHWIALGRFLVADQRLIDAAQHLDWHTFARIYNGPGYAKNRYDVKLSQAYKKLTGVS